ncbi:MAG: M28 family peptidase [Bacillota bacterium]|nr:M28 family peptidase [Bacillota bacterium]
MPITVSEQALLDSIDVATMWRHLEYLCTLDRTSGSPGEREAAGYLLAELQRYGCEVRRHEFDAYLSYPVSGCLLVPGVAPGEFAAKTRAFSASTPPGGATGEIIYVPGSSDMFTDTQTVERLRRLDLRGKIVLSEGGGRENMVTARRLGAAAYIHMWPSDEPVIHEGIVTPIWGTPGPGAVETLPRIPVISIQRGDGLRLREAAAAGPVVATVHAETKTGWQRLVMPEAIIQGSQSENFVLVAGHLDSWHLGATDNATGNVACLELARVLQARRDELRRGVRIAWWPGHSTGRYAGSTWYCDRFWQELHDHCITYINIDSPGCLGAYDYSLVTAVAENAAFAQDIVREITGVTPAIERPVRAGDQSFWGPGTSSLFMLLSNRPPGQRAAVGGSGLGWWWHTEEDTIDKCEAPVLAADTRIYALATWRLCTAELLPLHMAPLAREMRSRLAELSAGADGASRGRPSPGDLLGDVVREAAQLLAVAERFDAGAAAVEGGAAPDVSDAFNRAALAAIRWLTPVNYSPAPPHEHGPASPTAVIPLLDAAAALGAMDPAAEEYGFHVADVMRRANAVRQALVQARRALEGRI